MTWTPIKMITNSTKEEISHKIETEEVSIEIEVMIVDSKREMMTLMNQIC